MKKTLIATATAGLIAVGALVGTTSTASTAGGPSGGPGYSTHSPQQQCRPVFKTVRWLDKQGHRHFKKVVVRQKCRQTSGPGGAGQGPNPSGGPPHTP